MFDLYLKFWATYFEVLFGLQTRLDYAERNINIQKERIDDMYDVCILVPVPSTTPALQKSYAAASVITGAVANHAGAAGNTIQLYGFTY
jgi:hypothetical protein